MYLIKKILYEGGFRGGGGVRIPPPLEIRPPTDPKGPPSGTLKKSSFGRPTWKFFWSRLRRQYTKFEGGVRAKENAFIWSKFSKKCLKTLFWPVFSKFCSRRWKFGQNRDKTVLWESSKKQNLVDLKKKVEKNLKNCLKIRTTLEKILDPPLILYQIFFVRILKVSWPSSLGVMRHIQTYISLVEVLREVSCVGVIVMLTFSFNIP